MAPKRITAAFGLIAAVTVALVSVLLSSGLTSPDAIAAIAVALSTFSVTLTAFFHWDQSRSRNEEENHDD